MENLDLVDWNKYLGYKEPKLGRIELFKFPTVTTQDLINGLKNIFKNMKTIKVPVINNSTNELPAYADNGFNSGCDVRADITKVVEKFLFDAYISIEDNVIKNIVINPGGRALIPTGLHVAIPEGYEIQIRPRSGLALKQGISCTNSPATIDAKNKKK